MKDGKRGFFILLAVFIVLAVSQTFITTEDLVVRLFNLVSFYAVMVGTILYGIGIFKRIKPVNYVAIPIIFIGYGYSIYEVLSKYPKFEIELGIMIYALSFVAFVVSIIMKDTIKLEINEAEAETVSVQGNEVITKEEEKPLDVVFGTYISGIPKRPELSKKVCLLGYRDDLGKFSLFITNGDKVETIDISYGIVKNITSRNRVVMDQGNSIAEDTTQDRQTLINEVSTIYGNKVADEILNNNKSNTSGVSYNDLFELNLEFSILEDTRRLIINIDKDPTDFINKFNSVDKSNTEVFKISQEIEEDNNNTDTPPVIDVNNLAQTNEVKEAIEKENNDSSESLIEEEKEDTTEELI